MKKRALSLLMAVIMVVSLLPTAVWAAGTGISSFFENFEDILVAETEPGSPSSTNKWKTTTYDGETVLMSGNKGKDGASSTLQLTFKTATHASFEYKVSTEDKYDKVNIKLGSTSLLKDASGDLAWKTCEFDAEHLRRKGHPERKHLHLRGQGICRLGHDSRWQCNVFRRR